MVAQRGCGAGILKDTQNTIGQAPEQPYLGDSNLSWELNWMISRHASNLSGAVNI